MRANLPELLLPVGDAESLDTALLFGANAVYLGADGPNLRAAARGFGGAALGLAVARAHAAGVKVYVCVNAAPRQQDLPLAARGLEVAAEACADGVIVADAGVLRLARRHAPGLPVHVSTQANTRNAEALAFWREAGAVRANLARECAAAEVAALCRARDSELPGFGLELFAHGAQCMAYSGRCMLSVQMTERGVNQPGRTAGLGACAHPCRYEYRVRSVVEEYYREGADAWEVLEHPAPDRKSAAAPGGEPFVQFFAPQDLCLVWHARWLARLGVDALKVEGRTRSSAYLAVVADAWRFALDSLAAGDFQPRRALAELRHAATRPLTTGLFGADARRPVPGLDLRQPRRAPLLRVNERLGADAFAVEAKGGFDPARPEGLEWVLPGLARPRLAPAHFRLERGQDGTPLAGTRVHQVHPGMRLVLRLSDEARDLAGRLAPGIFAR